MGAMPELPEVEVVRRGLMPLLAGRKIRSVALMHDNLRYPLPSSFATALPGQLIKSVKRRAKYLLFQLDPGPVLVWHLGMTGQFHVLPESQPHDRHEHIRITLDNGMALCYRDARRFGYAGLIPLEELPAHPWFARLGPEPLEREFDAEYLHRHCAGRNGPIKSLLMNAGVVVGVGNIYASESLFRCSIHPALACRKLSHARVARLVDAVKEVLREAIDAGGSSISDFVRVDGRPGYFAHSFQVYGREGLPCTVCGKPILRFVQSGRSTFFCPGCQR